MGDGDHERGDIEVTDEELAKEIRAQADRLGALLEEASGRQIDADVSFPVLRPPTFARSWMRCVVVPKVRLRRIQDL